MPPTIMSRGLVVPYTRTRRSIARSSASVPSRHTQFSAAFTTNIAESNFRYTHPKSDTSLAIAPNDRGLSLGHRARLCGAATIPHPRLKGLGRSSPFSHAPFEIFEVVVHLQARIRAR